MEKVQQVVLSTFKEKFNETPLLVCSPGRVNLIGEHTDYNYGFVLPAAIDKAVYVAISNRTDGKIHLVASDLNEEHITSIEDYSFSEKHWPNYILGVVDELIKLGKTVSGFNAVVSGDVPSGAGMSSSAALECAICFSLNHLNNLGLDKLTIAQTAQNAENNFVGMKCGIMDQFASVFGKKDHVIRLDCRSLEYEYEPFNLEGIKIVLFDSMVKHSLASSEYNVRRSQCQEGISIIQQKYPKINNLREATPAIVEECLSDASPDIYHRCKYVVEEIERLLAACEDLKEGDLAAFGQKMYETHKGLSELYEVSCPELDFIATTAKKENAILGARMMGGGFGGCVIALVKENELDNVIKRMKEAFFAKYNIGMNVYISEIQDGTRILN